jgi:hypothetical protein
VHGEFNPSTVPGDVIDERQFIREVISTHVHERNLTRDTFHHGAIPGFGHDQIDRYEHGAESERQIPKGNDP